MGHLNLCSRMKHFLPLAALITLGSAQFVFFGNGRTAQQSFSQPAAVAPVQPQRAAIAPVQPQRAAIAPVQPQRAAPAPVQPQRFGVARPQPEARVPVPSPTFVSGRFAGTFFRPNRKLHHPGKNPLPAENPDDVKFVEILTEPPVRAEAPRSSVVTSAPVNAAILPAAVVPTAAPVAATTAAPVTTVAPVTTRAPVTTTPKARITTVATVRVTPLQIRSSIVNSFGAAVARPAPATPAPRVAPVVPTVNPRQPKALAIKPKGNYQYEGKDYLLTWRMGRNNFDWRGGVSFCKSKGMKLISLDNKEKTEHFLRLVATDRSPYFWSGGQVSRDSRTLTWPNGKTEPIARGQHPWSFTGRTGPQPDGGETCLAVLNSVYRDGVKFHDVACHHRKPVVCEE